MFSKLEIRDDVQREVWRLCVEETEELLKYMF